MTQCSWVRSYVAGLKSTKGEGSPLGKSWDDLKTQAKLFLFRESGERTTIVLTSDSSVVISGDTQHKVRLTRDGSHLP